MKLSDGLFLEVSKKVAKEYPEIKHNNMIIDVRNVKNSIIGLTNTFATTLLL